MLIMGTLNFDGSSKVYVTNNSLILPSLLLILIPFNAAALNLYLRQMRDMSEITIGVYTVMTMFFVYSPIVLLSESGLSIVKTFNQTDWIISVLLGFTSSSMQIVKAKSAKYEEPARVAVLNYFAPIFQLFLDVLFFHSEFSLL